MLNLTPRKTRGLSAGGGISAKDRASGLTGFIGSASFSQRNLFGLNQKLAVTLEAGQVQPFSLKLIVRKEFENRI